jgi:NitT/TauT family transport system substrate-binding protein
MRRLTAALAMLAATVLVATGCGDDGGSGGGGGTPEQPEKVKIGLIPIADVAPVFVGMK